MSGATLRHLQAALAAEHAAVWGYGEVGAHLSGAEQQLAAAALDTHRVRRDRLVALVRATGAIPVPAPGSYDLPAPVTDRADALALAVRLEQGCGQRCYDLAAATGAARDLAVDGLTDTATRAAIWRAAAGSTPATVAFPGRG